MARVLIEPDRIYRSDALSGLKRLPDQSVDCVVTSPPYWALRDYGSPETTWGDGTRAALGLEQDLGQYLKHLLEVFDQIRQVLKKTGTLWVNLGDTYHNATKWTMKGEAPQTIAGRNNRGFCAGRRANQGLPEKCLSLIPERFVLEMVNRGWILRNRICWHKPNHMPSSVKDRFACSWEYLFFFVKSRRYYFDLDSVREPHKSLKACKARSAKQIAVRKSPHITGNRLPPNPGGPQALHPRGKNPGDYWNIPTQPFTGTRISQMDCSRRHDTCLFSLWFSGFLPF